MGSHRAPSRATRRASRNAASVTSQTSRAESSAAPSSPGRRIAAKPEKPARQTQVARRAESKHSGSRGKLIRALPSLPALGGVAVLAIAMAGAVHATPTLVSHENTVHQANAMSGNTASSSSDLLSHRTSVSRDSRRDALADSADADLVAAAEQQAQQRNAELAKFASQVEQQSKKDRKSVV